MLEGILLAVLLSSNPAPVRSNLVKQKIENVYTHYSLEELCSGGREKHHLYIDTNVSTFKLNSSQISSPFFRCHLELEVKNSNYGFSVFIEEMTFAGSMSSCSEDYLQFGRDILFVTSHRSSKYCGDVEPPVATTSQGMTGFHFPHTPLVRRIYTEEVDKEMDVWLRISSQDPPEKTLSLVVTPFKKFCGWTDLQYRQCRYSTKCVRKELFCDGRINCAWPYSEPADEVYCKDISTGNKSVWNSSNIPVLIVVSIVILGAITLLCIAVAKLTSKVKKFNDIYSEDGGLNEPEANNQEFQPSCPPLPEHPLIPLSSLPYHSPPHPLSCLPPTSHPPTHPSHLPPPYSPPRKEEQNYSPPRVPESIDAPPSYSTITYQQ